MKDGISNSNLYDKKRIVFDFKEDLLELKEEISFKIEKMEHKQESVLYNLITPLKKQKEYKEEIKRLKSAHDQIVAEYLKLGMGAELFIQ